jgi:hypothetical protein
MGAETYLPTDLQRRYRAILDEARAGEARVRDSDGTNILLLLESKVQILRQVSTAAANLAAVEEALDVMATRRPTVTEFGDWSWLRVFDPDDLRAFIHDIREAIVVSVREGSTALLDEQLRAWRITAEQADDPLFRAILLNGAAEGDFVEVQRPDLDKR